MTADTREQEMEAHRAWIQPVFKDGLRKWDEWRDLNQVDAAEPVTKAAFLAGHAVVHAELRPLIEAARAYRDAVREHEAYVEAKPIADIVAAADEMHRVQMLLVDGEKRLLTRSMAWRPPAP
jgi:hypothetical protein